MWHSFVLNLFLYCQKVERGKNNYKVKDISFTVIFWCRFDDYIQNSKSLSKRIPGVKEKK